MIVKINEIKIEKSDANNKRVRAKLGNIQELAVSIKKRGLLHPIIIDKIEDALPTEPVWRLIAGERRLKASILNGATEIETNLLSDIDDIAAKEIELEENVMRQNLSWQEECEALRQLDELKKTKYGTAQPGSDTGWSMEDTAKTVGMSRSNLSDSIKLAKDLIDNPDIAKKVAKLPKSAAKKIMKQKIKAKLLQHQVDSKQLTISNDLRLGDCCQLIDELKDCSIDLLITDPPFGVADISAVAKSGANTYNGINETNVSTEETMRAVYTILLPKLFEKLKSGAHIYMFLGMGWYTELIQRLRNVGFEVDDLPLIWYKCRPSVIAKDMHYTSSYEAVLFGHKPPVGRILSKPIANVLSIPTIAGQTRVHSLQKPFDLLKIFIENSSSVGEVVLDCFAGSASTLVAARKLQRSAIGFELDEDNFLRAQKFIQENK